MKHDSIIQDVFVLPGVLNDAVLQQALLPTHQAAIFSIRVYPFIVSKYERLSQPDPHSEFANQLLQTRSNLLHMCAEI